MKRRTKNRKKSIHYRKINKYNILGGSNINGNSEPEDIEVTITLLSGKEYVIHLPGNSDVIELKNRLGIMMNTSKPLHIILQ